MNPGVIPFAAGASFDAVLVQVLPDFAGPYAFVGEVENQPYRLSLLFHNIGIATFIGIKAKGVLKVVDRNARLKLSLKGEVCVV